MDFVDVHGLYHSVGKGVYCVVEALAVYGIIGLHGFLVGLVVMLKYSVVNLADVHGLFHSVVDFADVHGLHHSDGKGAYCVVEALTVYGIIGLHGFLVGDVVMLKHSVMKGVHEVGWGESAESPHMVPMARGEENLPF